MNMSTQKTDNPNENIVEQPNVSQQPHVIDQSNAIERPTESPVETTHQGPADFPAAYQTNRSSNTPAGRKGFLKMTREQLMAAIGECAATLGHVPSHAELMRSGKVSGRQ